MPTAINVASMHALDDLSHLFVTVLPLARDRTVLGQVRESIIRSLDDEPCDRLLQRPARASDATGRRPIP